MRVSQLILLAGGLVLSACHSLTPAQVARAEKFKCEAEALAPLVEPALDAVKLAEDIYKGQAQLDAALAFLHVTQVEADALNARLAACKPGAEPAAAPDEVAQ